MKELLTILTAFLLFSCSKDKEEYSPCGCLFDFGNGKKYLYTYYRDNGVIYKVSACDSLIPSPLNRVCE